MKKNEERKIVIGKLVRKHTLASNGWIAARLQMGDPSRESRYCGSATESSEVIERQFRKLEKMSICKDRLL